MKRYLKLLMPIVSIASMSTACAAVPTGQVVVVGDNAIEFAAVVGADNFAAEHEMDGYHFIVWDGGSAADHALLRADVSDVQVIDALEGLGAVPGNALAIDSWDDRFDAAPNAADRVIEGPRLRIEIHVPGRPQPLTIGEVLEDSGNRGFDMRFGGHRDNIPAWHSGCVVCLYSCPGSKVGNAAYTVRDFVAGTAHFAVRPGVLPPDGSTVRVRLVLDPEVQP